MNPQRRYLIVALVLVLAGASLAGVHYFYPGGFKRVLADMGLIRGFKGASGAFEDNAVSRLIADSLMGKTTTGAFGDAWQNAVEKVSAELDADTNDALDQFAEILGGAIESVDDLEMQYFAMLLLSAAGTVDTDAFVQDIVESNLPDDSASIEFVQAVTLNGIGLKRLARKSPDYMLALIADGNTHPGVKAPAIREYILNHANPASAYDTVASVLGNNEAALLERFAPLAGN